mgnify:CR=1 FL=1
MAATTLAPGGFDPDKFKATARAQWQAAADRFGVAPRTVETYVEQMS